MSGLFDNIEETEQEYLLASHIIHKPISEILQNCKLTKDSVLLRMNAEKVKLSFLHEFSPQISWTRYNYKFASEFKEDFYNILCLTIEKLTDIINHMIKTYKDKRAAGVYFYSEFLYMILCMFEIYDNGIIDMTYVYRHAEIFPYIKGDFDGFSKTFEIEDFGFIEGILNIRSDKEFYKIYFNYEKELCRKFGLFINTKDFVDIETININNKPYHKTEQLFIKLRNEKPTLINNCLSAIDELETLFENSGCYKITISDPLSISKTILENVLEIEYKIM